MLIFYEYCKLFINKLLTFIRTVNIILILKLFGDSLKYKSNQFYQRLRFQNSLMLTHMNLAASNSFLIHLSRFASTQNQSSEFV